ncbi:MAG: endonuclease [Isosphaeraceae bacterium]
MAAQNKAQFLNEIHNLLKKRYKPRPERASRLTVLEAVVYGVCHEGTTREQANQALSRYKDGFFDWNEVRVSTIEEVQSALAGLPDSEARAQRIRRFLRQLFEKTYGFTLEALTKKPLKESLKALSEYEAFTSDYVEATVVQQSLGGHAMPVDGPARRALLRLGVVEESTEVPAIRSSLERAIPKNRGVEFGDLIEELAHDTCVEPEPDCPRCELRKICPTAATRKEQAATAAKAATAQAKATAKEAARVARGESTPPPEPAPAPAPPSVPAPVKAKESAKSAKPATPPPPPSAPAKSKGQPKAAEPPTAKSKEKEKEQPKAKPATPPPPPAKPAASNSKPKGRPGAK